MKNQHTEQCPEAVKAQAPRLSEEVPPRNTRTHGEQAAQGEISSHRPRSKPTLFGL